MVDLNESWVLPQRINCALASLLDSFHYASQTTRQRWDFAVDIQQLDAIGLTINDYRFLVLKGWVEHRREMEVDLGGEREFHREGELHFSDRSCFVLTEDGVAISSSISEGDVSRLELRPQSIPLALAQDDNREGKLVPKWDGVRRTLFCGANVVKGFRWPARNQEAILSAFEEEEWPFRIDDPLPPSGELEPKRRLSDTIKCLNQRHQIRSILFRGDGTGKGIIWEFLSKP